MACRMLNTSDVQRTDARTHVRRINRLTIATCSSWLTARSKVQRPQRLSATPSTKTCTICRTSSSCQRCRARILGQATLHVHAEAHELIKMCPFKQSSRRRTCQMKPQQAYSAAHNSIPVLQATWRPASQRAMAQWQTRGTPPGSRCPAPPPADCLLHITWAAIARTSAWHELTCQGQAVAGQMLLHGHAHFTRHTAALPLRARMSVVAWRTKFAVQQRVCEGGGHSSDCAQSAEQRQHCLRHTQ